MNIAPAYLDALEALGYTEAEARFLYIVATHSGYFVARQFLGFTGASWGKRTAAFWNKLRTNKHARTERFPKSGTTYHLFSRRLYRQIDRESVRNRRPHEVECVQRLLGILDFVLSHPDWKYLETEAEKVRFFRERLNVPSEFLPAKIYHVKQTAQPTVRYFVDGFPMFLGADLQADVVTFTYLPGPTSSFTQFAHHLKDYLPLFRRLPEFRFLYLARFDFHFQKAKELFDSLVTIPLGSDVSGDLFRYFQIRKAWDLGRYASLTEADLIFRNQAKARFAGQRFEQLYCEWKTRRLPESRILEEFGGTDRQTTARFAAEVLCRFGSGQRAKATDEEGQNCALPLRLP
jgi:hypothetical protein